MDSFVSFREGFYKLVEDSQHVVITAHYSPDDDSIASVLSVFTILTTKYPQKDIRIIYTGEKSERHQIFHNFEHIEWVDDVGNHLSSCDLLIVLDVSRIYRISKIITQAPEGTRTVSIDHHASIPDEFTLASINPQYSSNAENIYHVLDCESLLTKELAELFLLGILGDTNNFSHVQPSQSEVFVIAKKLIEMVGTPIDAFRARYGGIPRRIIPLLQELVQHTTYTTIEGWPDVQYTYIKNPGEYSDEDMSAASHIYMGQYLTRVQGYGWGLVATPRSDNTVRISGRSLPGSVNVRDLFDRMAIGGGHDRASGAYMKEADSEVAIQKIFDWMKQNKPVIN